MYKKLIKKYYLYKIFTISIPVKKHCNPTYYIMTKYLIERTPFFNLKILLQEFSKILHLFNFSNCNKNSLLFLGSNKIFLLNSHFLIKKKLNYIDWKVLKRVYLYNWEQTCVLACIYNYSPQSKLISFIKDLKIISLGFLNSKIPINILDYVFPLECSMFSNIYFFHYVLKKILNATKN